MSQILNLVGFESALELLTFNGLIATDTVRTGASSMKINQYGKYCEIGLANGNSFNGKYAVIRFYINVQSAGMMGNEEICRFHNSTNNINLRLNPGMTLQLYNDNTSLGTYGTFLATNTWHRIEFACFAGKVVLLVNGIQALSVPISNYNWTNIFLGSYVNRNSQFMSIYFDDVCLTDDFFPGSGEVVKLPPIAISGWTGSNSDISDNNLTTAISNNTTGSIADITVTAYNNSKTIRCVKPWILSKEGSVSLRCGNREQTFNNPATYDYHRGFISTSKDQAVWSSQPDLSIKNLSNTTTFIAEAGILVEYGSNIDPCLIDFGYADEISSGPTIMNSADPVLVQFAFKYTSNTDIVQIGEYKLSMFNNNIRLTRNGVTIVTGTTTLSTNTYYTLKFMLGNYNNTTLYRLLINNINEFNSSTTNTFTTGNIVFTNTITVKSVILTGDLWYMNSTVTRRSPIGPGSLSNYAGSYTDISEYPLSTADFITLNSGSGGAYFSISTITPTIYAIKQVIACDSGFSITILGETMTAPPPTDIIRQYDYGTRWYNPTEVKIDFSGVSSAKVYNMYYLALVDNSSVVINSPSFLLFA